MTHDSDLVVVYLLILAFHFGYAFYLIQNKKDLLHFGKIHDKRIILSVLILINSIPLSTFFFPNRTWLILNIVFQAGLAIYELIENMKKGPHHIPFFFDHVGFILIIALSNMPS